MARLGRAGYTSPNPTGPIDYSQNVVPGQGLPVHAPTMSLQTGPIYPDYPYAVDYPYRPPINWPNYATDYVPPPKIRVVLEPADSPWKQINWPVVLVIVALILFLK
jgi:hypothetical protein